MVAVVSTAQLDRIPSGRRLANGKREFLATKISPAICVAAGVAAFGGAAWLFASAFSRRSGGALFRLRGG